MRAADFLRVRQFIEHQVTRGGMEHRKASRFIVIMSFDLRVLLHPASADPQGFQREPR